MSKQIEALKLALEALELHGKQYPHMVKGYCLDAITAIREALAEQPAQQRPQNCGTGYCSCIECLFEPEHQEPVAYAVYHRMGGSKSLHWSEQHSEDGDHNEYRLVPLYASPQPSKPLTDEQIMEMYNEPRSDAEMIAFARAIEAAHGIKGDA